MQTETRCPHVPGRCGGVQSGQDIPQVVSVPGLYTLLAPGLEERLQPFVLEAFNHVTEYHISRNGLQYLLRNFRGCPILCQQKRWEWLDIRFYQQYGWQRNCWKHGYPMNDFINQFWTEGFLGVAVLWILRKLRSRNQPSPASPQVVVSGDNNRVTVVVCEQYRPESSASSPTGQRSNGRDRR